MRAIRQTVPVQRLYEVLLEPGDGVRNLAGCGPGDDQVPKVRAIHEPVSGRMAISYWISGASRGTRVGSSRDRAVLWRSSPVSCCQLASEKLGGSQPSSIHSRLIVDSRSSDASFDMKGDAPAPRNAWLVARSAIAVNMITFVVGFTRLISRDAFND